MIGSFWNLCRACPSMPVDKLHSEYRSTYRWHEYTGPRQEVVRRPPQSSGGNAGSGKSQAVMNQGNEEEQSHVQDGSGSPSAAVGSTLEPALPRKKKHPELAYKTHEFLAMSDGGSDDSLESTVSFDRARSEERTGRRFRPSRRSKSEGPPTRDFPFQSEYRLQYGKLLAERQAYQDQLASGVHNGHKNDDWEEEMMTASFPPPAPPGTNKPRISTEYRLQFAWPRASDILVRKAEAAGGGGAAAGGGPPRKSLSMGAIRPAISNLVPVHRMKRTEDVEGASELEPLVGSDDTTDGGGGEEKIQEESLSKEEKPRRRKEFKTEYKKRFRPFSQYEYAEGRFTKKKENDVIGTPIPDVSLPVPLPDYTSQAGDAWYHEVLELRKKAGEYKHRGWGTELVPQHIAELYNKQMALWEQVSRRSSLSALSLASTSPRSITKEEKEKENSKKSSPTKSLLSSRMGRAIEERLEMERKKADKDNEKKEVPRSRKEFLIRHHLERTTGAVDGALLPSPTREKLEPVILRRKDEDITIKSPSKSSPKSSPRSARSQSVGPISENRSSPKRQPRAPSVAPAANTANSKPQNGPIHSERRPRPTSLSTAPSRPKSSSVAMRNEEVKSSQHHAMKPKHNLPAAASTGKSIVNGTHNAGKVNKGERIKPVPEKKHDTSDDNVDGGDDRAASELPAVHTQKPTPSTEPPAPLIEECEPIVKSPPEPTRVKSPEQILMRSPEPVNWTVPLDTGKTFTVTQNVRDAVPTAKLARGELSRPHSETKQWGAPSTEQEGDKAGGATSAEEPVAGWKSDPSSDPMTTSMLGSFSTVNGLEDEESSQHPPSLKPQAPPVSYEKVVAGTTLKCLDDPTFDDPSSCYPTASSPYRVLESTPRPAPTSTPYRILEAPESPNKSTNAPLMSPNSSRSLASDVLEKARTRFDKFWGKSKDSDDKV